nr:hypothetical protein [Tanacetum cinerariifolium]
MVLLGRVFVDVKPGTREKKKKYSVKLNPEPSKIYKPTIDLVPEKSALEIRKIKKEHAEKQKMPNYTIKSTDKVTLKEYDIKSTLYQTMNENKSFNRNPANHALYHTLMEPLIEDEKAMDKGVVDTVKNHKRQHDGPVYNLLKGTCTSNIKLKYNIEECFKALTDRLDWNNPKGDRCPFDLTKPLPLKGRPSYLTVTAEYFFKNDLKFLKSFDSKKNYTTSITKTKVARYEIVGIQDMVPTLWSPTKVGVKKLHGYGHLEEIVVKRVDRQLYKFKEGDFVDLHLNEIENMLFLAVQHKLFHLNDSDIVDFIVALRMFTRSLIIKRCVKDLQLGVESYQKKLNITKPHKTFPEIEFKELFTSSQKPPGNTRFSSGIEQEDIKAKVDDYRQKEVKTYGQAY